MFCNPVGVIPIEYPLLWLQVGPANSKIDSIHPWKPVQGIVDRTGSSVVCILIIGKVREIEAHAGI